MKRIILNRVDGSPVYIESESFASKSAGIILSGEHYTIRNPLLYYSRNILFELRIDYYGIDFLYTSNKKYLEACCEEKAKTISEDMKLITKNIEEISSRYENLVVISKSNGLYFVEEMLKDERILNKVQKIVLFSPGNIWNEMIPKLIEYHKDIMIIAGSNDKMYDVPNMELIS